MLFTFQAGAGLNGCPDLARLDHFGAYDAIRLAVAHPDTLTDAAIGHGDSGGIHRYSAGLHLNVYGVASLDHHGCLKDGAAKGFTLVQRALQFTSDNVVRLYHITLAQLADIDHLNGDVTFTDHVAPFQLASRNCQGTEEGNLGWYVDGPALGGFAARLYRQLTSAIGWVIERQGQRLRARRQHQPRIEIAHLDFHPLDLWKLVTVFQKNLNLLLQIVEILPVLTGLDRECQKNHTRHCQQAFQPSQSRIKTTNSHNLSYPHRLMAARSPTFLIPILQSSTKE